MEKVITWDKYEEMWGELEESFHAASAKASEQMVSDALDNILRSAGHTIEPEPILPGVTGGDWEVRGPHKQDKYKWRIYDGPMCKGDIIGLCNTEADAQVMSGSKKLVELVVAEYKAVGWKRSNSSGKSKAVVDQLEEMGVEEFGGDV